VKIVIAGGTGWLGSALSQSLVRDGHDVVVLSRSTRDPLTSTFPRVVRWDGQTVGSWKGDLDGADAVVNLCGESIASGRWNLERKRRLLTSRTEPTRALVAAIAEVSRKPAVLLNASAVGYYGDRGDHLITEDDPSGTDFLARLVVEWESAAREAEALGVRVCLMRQGIVVGRGGFIGHMAVPFRFFLGAYLGSGRQWVSWVHVDDVVGLFRLALERMDAVGPINVTSPEPVTNRELAQTLGAVLGRPVWFSIPGIMVHAAVGEIADQLLTGQRVVPAAARRLGYAFRAPQLGIALRQALCPAA